MKRGWQPRMSGCRGKDGRVIGEEGKILGRWTEYFTEMLNEEEDREDKEDYKRNLIVKLDHVLEQPQEICKEPTRQAIGYAIQRVRNNRAPGEDTIVAGLILECNNYRGITLLNSAYKIFSGILNGRLKIATEKTMGHQCAFRRNESTIDQLFIL